MIKNTTFGSDPEYFVINKDENVIISGIPFIDGDKTTPESLGDGFYVLKDNVLAEGNIPPTSDPMQFMLNLIELKQRINKYLMQKHPSLEVAHADCLTINPAFLTHPESLMFGCSPYLNAWDNDVHKANDLASENFRTCGFHIHIGYDKTSDNPFNRGVFNKIIAKAFDLFVIIPSMFTHFDRRRFENYGGLGQYRDTPYGLECRSLGGFFVDEKYLPWVIEQTCRMLTYVKDYGNASSLMALTKPVIKFVGGNVTFDASVYEDMNLSFQEQLLNDKYKVYASS